MTAPTIRNEAIGLKAGALALLAAVLWGGNSVSIKMGLGGIPPVALAGIRFALGALTVLVGALFSAVPIRVPATKWAGLVGLVALFCVQILLLNVGTHFTNASRSTVLMSTYPFFIAFFAHFFIPGDRLSSAKVAGLALSFIGVLLIFTESLGLGEVGYLYGDLMILASAILLGLRHIVLKRLMAGLHPFQVLFWQAFLSLPLFAGLSVWLERDATYDLSPVVIGAVLYQGLVVAGICFILMVSLLQRHSASRLGVFGFVTPIFGVLLSALLLGDELSPLLLASMGLVAAGIAVVNRETG